MEVRDPRIKNETVRKNFCNIPKIEFFITRKIAHYISKIVSTEVTTLPKQFLGSWIQAPRGIAGTPKPPAVVTLQIQSSIYSPPPTKKSLLFREWTPLATDETTWNHLISAYLLCTHRGEVTERAERDNYLEP